MERFGAEEELLLGPPPPAPDQRRRQLLILAAVVAVVILIAGGSIIANQSREPAGGSAPTPTPTPRSTTSSPESASPTASANPRPVVRTFGPSLRDLGVDLFARGENTVFRIETRAGRITTTPLAALDSTGPISLIAGPEQVLLRSMNEGPGYTVRDGQPARALTGRLGEAGTTLPGPPNRLWISTHEWGSPMTLVDFEGRSTGRTVNPGYGGLVGDGAGGLLLSDVGGTYEATPAGARRLTRGVVLAVGPRHLLLADCDAQHICSSFLYDRSTRTQRRLARVQTNELPTGLISPNGRYAALATYPGNGESQLFGVIELLSGRSLIPQGEIGMAEFDTLAESHLWLPDNRLVGLRRGRLYVLDPNTGKIEEPGLGLPALVQITARVRN